MQSREGQFSIITEEIMKIQLLSNKIICLQYNQEIITETGVKSYNTFVATRL